LGMGDGAPPPNPNPQSPIPNPHDFEEKKNITNKKINIRKNKIIKLIYKINNINIIKC